MKRNKKSLPNLDLTESNQSPHLNREWLENKYINEGLSTYEIGKLVNRNPKNIYNKLKDFGIPTRTRAETIQQNAWWKQGRPSGRIGLKHSEESKRQIAETRATKTYPKRFGKDNPMFGVKGDKHPNWKGGVTPERQKIYATGLWKEISRLVFERDQFLCKRCGVPNRLIHAHHVKGWADYPDNRLDLDNLVTVCKKCHNWIHSNKNTNKDFIA